MSEAYLNLSEMCHQLLKNFAVFLNLPNTLVARCCLGQEMKHTGQASFADVASGSGKACETP